MANGQEAVNLNWQETPAVPSDSALVPYAIDIVSLSKKFRRHTLKQRGYTTLKSGLLSFFSGKGKTPQECTQAIRDVTLRIPQGSSLGIIGRNGSGKSTLLKLITGIYKPDTGKVSINGRLAALIELGAGFHPDFTGRENLFVAGIMHGLKKSELEERFSEIVEFAELENVIDDPVRTYSSGMFMRLGFSLAVHTDPDVLLIDEVLSVGDAAFVAKCKDKIGELRKAGRTLLLVSHDLDSVQRWCDEAVWLHEGEVRDRGFPRRVIDHYLEFLEKGEERKIIQHEIEVVQDARHSAEVGSLPDETKEFRWGSREISIQQVRLHDKNGEDRRVFHPEDSLVVQFDYIVNEPRDEIVFGIAIERGDGLLVYGSNTDIEQIQLPLLGTAGTVSFEIGRLGLLEGAYAIDVAVHKRDGYAYDYQKGAMHFVVRSAHNEIGVFVPQHNWRVYVGKS